MNFKHTTVLLNETLENLNIKPNGIYMDGTLGGAGHSEEICKKLNNQGLLIGVDQDEEALKASNERLSKYSNRIELVHSNFSDINFILDSLNIDGIDGIILDLGVSSYQLDNKDRGFSYMSDAELDMRMDRSNNLTAKEIVNTYSMEDLKDVIYKYGEEKWGKRIAEFIIEERKKGVIENTGQLVEIIKAAIPSSARRTGPHPAKRTFQALRIEVNNELGILEKAVKDITQRLKPGGRICIITFHSLEDRIIKNTFKELNLRCICPKEFPVCMCNKKSLVKIISRKPIIPSQKEIEDNPRSRSAKLRVAERI